MSKRKIELNDDVDQLVNKYLEATEDDFNELANDALLYYIKKRLTSKEVREALKNKGDDSSKYLDEYIQNSIQSHWNI
ncbi:hypothetical protein [Lactobacillus agrestimuris]|uniref:hypothetical protein n=1 Tax=Lactobacillus agrestimuris TaxID=2941328 RepID=UPI0020444893|nr:hypothetical protein [Lactobacillus agrestimuris]